MKYDATSSVQIDREIEVSYERGLIVFSSKHLDDHELGISKAEKLIDDELFTDKMIGNVINRHEENYCESCQLLEPDKEYGQLYLCNACLRSISREVEKVIEDNSERIVSERI